MVNPGISILVRAGPKLDEALAYLNFLVKCKGFKTIEVLLIAEDFQKAIQLTDSFIRSFYLRVLSSNSRNFSSVIKNINYENCLIVDLPVKFSSDILLNCFLRKNIKQDNLFFCSANELKKFENLNLFTPLVELATSYFDQIKFTSEPAQQFTISENLVKHTQSELLKPRGDEIKFIHQKAYSDNEFFERYGWMKPLVPNKKLIPLENASEDFSNKDVHRCSIFKPAKSNKLKFASPFKIITLCSDRLNECLSYDAELIIFDLSEWETQLATSPHYVLIESDFRVLQLENNPSFRSFLSACAISNIKVVFWHTDAKEHCALYCDLIKDVNHVVAVEQESVDYFNNYSKSPARLLEHAIQPALHNAIREKHPIPSYSNMKFFFDGWADLIEYREEFEKFLEPLSDNGLHIFDSKWEFIKHKLLETPLFIKNIHGSFNYQERLNALKHFDVCIIASPSMKSSSTLTLEALEAIATKRVVLYRGNNNFAMLDDLIRICSSDEDFLAEAQRLIDYPAYRDEIAHKAWRVVHSSHTFANRLNTLAEHIGLTPRIQQFPSVSAITVTKRPQLLITNAKNNYLQQEVPRKEWIIVVNTIDANLDEIEVALKDVENVRLFQVSSDKNIGFCLNMAIGKSQSDYWAKMDDDDYYGPKYLFDYSLNTNCIDFDLIGKLPSFTYLESEEFLYLRNKTNWRFHDYLTKLVTPHMCGATFCGTRGLIEKIRFSDSIRSAVDTTWYEECISHDIKILISDCYNMTIYRAADKSKHTWRYADHDLKKKALPVCFGKGSPLVNI